MQLTSEKFKKVAKEDIAKQEVIRPSVTYWQDVWRRLKSNKLAMAGLVIVIFMVLFVLVGPLISPYSYFEQNYDITNQGPSAAHLFGTDQFGRDILTRVMHGGRISLTIGFVVSILNLVIGVVYGGIAGYVGGKVDDMMMRVVDVLYSIPMMIYVILLILVLDAGVFSIIVGISISSWVGMARIVRGQVLSLKEQEFVLAAKTLGASPFRILFKHLIPNTMGPIIVAVTLAIPSAIFTESFLSYIGLGISAPDASWGTLCSEAMKGWITYPYQLFFPAMAICVTIFAFQLLGDGLRDALDPKMRK
ncbi:MAG: ABC transporter permease [Clostridium sp.]